MFSLKGKVAWVTGAARGMGRAHALALAKQGATVVATDLDLEGCRTTMKELSDACDSESGCFHLDVSNAEEVGQVVDGIIAQYGRLDILVNNAGIYRPKPFLDMTEADWDETMDANLKGQFLCAKRAAEEMKKGGGGRIINIASIASGQVGFGQADAAHYAASKGGVIAFTESIAAALAPHGILVNAIAPGAIDTPMIDDARMSESEKKAMLERIPLGRMGKPEEVAALVVYLASDEASYSTGSVFTIDGGWLAV